MKTFKTLTAVALLALSGASLASAVTIHITGSTAYRASTITAIANVLNAQGSGGVTAAYSGSSLTGANQSILFGPGGTTIVEASFSGSVGGLQTLTGGSATAITSFPSASTYASSATAVTLGGGNTAASGGFSISGTVTTEPATVPDLALSDVYKASTPYNLSTVTQTTVGIVPFKWLVNGSAPSTLTNMTSQIARQLFVNGSIPLAFFTGLNADETKSILAVGRDNDSGTRLTAFAETGVGASTVVNQSYPLNSSSQVVGNSISGVQSVGPITSTEIVPVSTVNGSTIAAGNGGYSSGGNLAFALGATDSIANTYFVTYLGTSDALTAENLNSKAPVAVAARELTFNGIPFSNTAIEEGQYTFWGYEHLDNLTSASTTVKSFVTSLKNQLNSGDDEASANGITISAMNVARTSDGGTVGPSY